MRLSNYDAWSIQEALMKKALEIIRKKRAGYSGDEPFRNFYLSEYFGIQPWKGAFLRLLDKVSRLNRLLQTGEGRDEGDETIQDTVIDAMNYLVIIFCLFLETLPEEKAKATVEELAKYAISQPWPKYYEA